MSLTNSEERQYSLPDEIRDLVEGAAARPASEILLEAADRLEAAEREQDKEKAEWRESIARAWKRTDAAESALAEAREAWKELRPFVRRRPDRLDAALAIHPKEQRSAAESALADAREAWAALAPHLPAEWDGGNLGYLVSDMDSALAIHPKEQRSAAESALAEAREAWAALTPHLPAEWDGGNLGYLVSDMDSALAIHPKEQRSAAESALAEAREAWKELRPFVRRRPDRLDAALEGDRADALAAAEQKIDLMRGWVEEQARGADQEHARALAAESALAERDKAIAEALEWLSPIRAPVPAEPGLRTSAAKARLILEDALAARPGEQK
jgi:hypothetical protein